MRHGSHSDELLSSLLHLVPDLLVQGEWVSFERGNFHFSLKRPEDEGIWDSSPVLRVVVDPIAKHNQIAVPVLHPLLTLRVSLLLLHLPLHLPESERKLHSEKVETIRGEPLPDRNAASSRQNSVRLWRLPILGEEVILFYRVPQLLRVASLRRTVDNLVGIVEHPQVREGDLGDLALLDLLVQLDGRTKIFVDELGQNAEMVESQSSLISRLSGIIFGFGFGRVLFWRTFIAAARLAWCPRRLLVIATRILLIVVVFAVLLFILVFRGPFLVSFVLVLCILGVFAILSIIYGDTVNLSVASIASNEVSTNPNFFSRAL